MADIRAAVPRAALIDTLRPVPAPTVVLVAAPAGYGKTTLLTQVAAATHRKPFASLTIGARDNDHRRLVAALGAALGIQATSAKSLAGAIAGGGALDLSIDDLHLLSSERSLDVLLALAASLPPRSRLLLAGRTRPPGPSGRRPERKAHDRARAGRPADVGVRGRRSPAERGRPCR